MPRATIARFAALVSALAFVAVVSSGCTVGIIAGVIALLIDRQNAANVNVAPTVAFGSITRTAGEVAIPVTLFDANGDSVSLTVQYDSGSGFTAAEVTPTSGLTATDGGTAHILTWDAPTDLGDTAFHSGITIRIVANDGTVSGAAATSDPFDYGNDNPTISAVSVDTDPMNRVAGNAVVRFTVADSSSDPINVTAFEYSAAGDFSDTQNVTLTTGSMGSFPSGSLTSLSSAPGAGSNHSFTWNSYLTEPGTVSGAKIRITLGDPLGGSSGPGESGTFDVANSVLVTIGTIARTTGEVSVPVTVFSTIDAMVTLTCEYDLGAGLQPASTTPPQLQGSAGGTAGVVTWDAPTDLGSTAYEGTITFQITPFDGVNTGPPAVSSSFEFGNDAPVITPTTLSVDTDGGTASGNIVVRFTVTDSASDTVSIDSFEYSLAGDFSDAVGVGLTIGQNGNFPSGALTGLPTTPGGIEHAITWNSRLVAPVDNPGTRVRVRVVDAIGAQSAYEPSQAFMLDNSDTTPPIAQLSVIKPADSGDIRTGAIWIDYVLIDLDGDACDVRVEYSTDGKQNWNPCTEYPSMDSEGPYDLPANTNGVLHRFVWDSAADLASLQSSLDIRVTPAATDGVGNPSETSIVISAGADPGTPVFADGDQLTTGNGSRFVRSGDLNRDGHTDLVVLNLAAGNLSVLLGRGNGTFNAATTVDVSNDPRQLALADFNADGFLDIAVTQFTNDEVEVLLGAGDGTFGAPATVSIGAPFEPVAIAAADVDADGHVDLLVGASGTFLLFTTGRLVFIKGNGDGTFGSTSVATIDHNPQSIAVGYFNGDNNLDAAVACRDDDNVNICLGNGSGGFPTINTAAVSSQPECLVAGFFNNDKNLDLAVVNTNSGSQLISILPGTGSGTFQAQTTFSTGQAEPRAIVTGDFTGDGRLDLATVHGNDQLVVLTGDGAAAFASPQTATCGTNARHMVVDDFNEDGTPDIAVARSNGSVSILPGRRQSGTWSTTLTLFNPGDGSGNSVGATTAPGGNDWFSSPRVTRIGLAPFEAVGGDRPDDLRTGAAVTSNDFANLLRLARLSPTPPHMEPLTRAWTVSGVTRMLRRPDPGGTDTGYRYEPIGRLGDRTAPGDNTDLRRAGLDLSDATFANQRGIIADLPFATTRTNGEITTALGAGKLRVYLRQTDWLRCDVFPADPLSGDGDALRYLPRVVLGGNFRDIYVERQTWLRVLPSPGNVLDAGTGPRFIIDTTNNLVRVLLDRDGIVQAYYEP
ncbi:MAG: FG-GAP-like repeat-containing protein [Planctomycetota bacterium]